MTKSRHNAGSEIPLSSETEHCSEDNPVVMERIQQMFSPYPQNAIMHEIKQTLLRLAGEGALNE